MGGFFGTANASPVAGMDTILGPTAQTPVGAPPPLPQAPPPPPAPQRTMVAAATPTPRAQPEAGPTIVSAPSDGAASAFAERFKGTPLANKWDVLRSSAERHGVPPALAASIMAHETGNGKSVKGNNPGGLMDPGSNWQRKQSFESIDKGIDATVGVIGRNYNASGGDLNKLAGRYAPQGAKNDPRGLNKNWLPGVKQIMAEFGQ